MDRYENAGYSSGEPSALSERELLEWVAYFSPRAEAELRRLRWAEAEAQAEARRKRELLEWLASISDEHELELHELLRKEAEERESQEQSQRLAEADWVEADHPRQPKGTPEGGQFASKGGAGGSGGSGGSGGGPLKSSGRAATQAASVPVVVTKQQLPADRRGTWVSGTKGNGVFRYNDSAENRLDNLVGKEARYENDHIAVGGFPQDTYHGGNADAVSLDIPKVTGLDADNLTADALMREKLGDPNWQRPEGYIWNHAGGPESKTVELVEEGAHGAIAHKGAAAVPRAIRRMARAGGGAAPGAMGALTAYMTARDALQAAGVLKPDYDEYGHATYHFIDKDGSGFNVVPGGWFSSPKCEFIDGPRKGQSETITNDQVEAYRKQAEDDWGKLVPGSLLRDPRFIPGKRRKTLPLMIDQYGVPHEAGWIDEEGVHRYPQPRPAVI